MRPSIARLSQQPVTRETFRKTTVLDTRPPAPASATACEALRAPRMACWSRAGYHTRSASGEARKSERGFPRLAASVAAPSLEIHPFVHMNKILMMLRQDEGYVL
jgi:hypothetical protein